MATCRFVSHQSFVTFAGAETTSWADRQSNRRNMRQDVPHPHQVGFPSFGHVARLHISRLGGEVCCAVLC